MDETTYEGKTIDELLEPWALDNSTVEAVTEAFEAEPEIMGAALSHLTDEHSIEKIAEAILEDG